MEAIVKNIVKILVTGSSGFIGMHMCEKLLNEGYQVLGLDNMNTYYDKNLKKRRLKKLEKHKGFTFKEVDISDLDMLKNAFNDFKPDKVINLAAQAGVRFSIKNPHSYINTNIAGFMNILECCRHFEVKGLIYASSSSVYGGNSKIPFSVKDRCDKPISIYAATKKANEMMAYSYSDLYGLRTTGLRFFTVYGEWGRPDMAIYIFTEKIINGEPIQVFNNGVMKRDFTYIDDIIDGIKKAMDKNYKCEIFNLGNNKTENLLDLIKIIEKNLKKKANIKFQGMQMGDVKSTCADIKYSTEKINYRSKTTINEGIPKFIDWYKKYNNINP